MRAVLIDDHELIRDAMKRTLSEKLDFVQVFEAADLDAGVGEAVEQAGVDAHAAEVLAQGLPVGSAAAGGAVVDADHPIAPDIGDRLAQDAHLVRWEIGDPPREPATEGAVAVRNPRGSARQLHPHVAAMTASVDSHGDL